MSGRRESLWSQGAPDGTSSSSRYGQAYKYDPDFKGPNDRRGCTDILCLLLFIAFAVAWAALGWYAYRYGDPERILQPTDSSGRRCGVDADVISQKFLLFFDPSMCAKPTVVLDGCDSPSVCVKDCPSESMYAPSYFDATYLPESPGPICLPDVKPTTGADLKKMVQLNKCARWYLKSKPVGKYCLPDLPSVDPNSNLEINGVSLNVSLSTIVDGSKVGIALMKAYEAGEKIVSDVLSSYDFILYALVGAMVICLLYIVLLRWITLPVVWISILGVIALFGAGTYFCYNYYHALKSGQPTVIILDSRVPAEVQTFLDQPNTWLGFTITLGAIGGILLLIVLFLRKRISLAIALIEEGGKAVSNITSTLFFPIVPWLLQIAVISYALVVILYLATSGDAVYKTHGLSNTTCACDDGIYTRDGEVCKVETFNSKCANCVSKGAICQFFRYSPRDYTIWMHLFNLFGMFWALFFVSGMAQMILSATFATYYWTYHKSDVPFFILLRSFFMCLSYHSGTVAFGSLLIAIVRTIRVVLEYIESKLKQYGGDNRAARAVLCCCQCCFTCLEKFLKFVSRNAYIMCAIHGKNFCASAKDAFNLLMRNVIRVVVLDKVMDFVFFMGKLLITALVCTALHFALIQWPHDLNYNAVPIVIAGIGAFLVATVFFGVYAMAVDTLFLCFLEDCERNDGSPQKPYFMSESLMRVFGKRNHFKRD